MDPNVLNMLIIILGFALGTIVLLIVANIIVQAIGNKKAKNNSKTNQNDKSKKNVSKDEIALNDDGKNLGYIYKENENLDDAEKLNSTYLLDLDNADDDANHYDESQAKDEESRAKMQQAENERFNNMFDFGNDDDDEVNDFMQNSETSVEDDDDILIPDSDSESDNFNNGFKSFDSDDEFQLSAFLSDDEDEYNPGDLNKSEYSDNTLDEISEFDNIELTDKKSDISEEDLQYRFEDENDTISPLPKSLDKNFETPSDEELIDFINQRALEDYEQNSNSLNSVNEKVNPENVRFEGYTNDTDYRFDFDDIANLEDDYDDINDINDINDYRNTGSYYAEQDRLAKSKQNIKSENETNASTTPEKIIEKVYIEVPVQQQQETPAQPEKTENELNRDRIKAEVNKQMQMNKLAEKDEYYKEEIRKMQEKHFEELQKLNNQLESSRSEMENNLQSKINQFNDSRDALANNFMSVFERMSSAHEEQQNKLMNELNELKEQIQKNSQPIVLVEEPAPVPPPVVEEPKVVVPDPIPVVIEEEPEEEEEEIDLPKKTDPRYEKLKIDLKNLEIRLKATDRSLRNNKKEYVPIMKAQKYINENNDRFNRKSTSIARLKSQLSKPKYADDKEKLAKYEADFAAYEQLRIDMTRNKEYLDLHASKIPILEKENATLTKQRTELENKIAIIKTELKRYE